MKSKRVVIVQCRLSSTRLPEKALLKLGEKSGAVGILLPPIMKDSFFETISGRGPLPRKSFSMGEADEKRFYLECRKLF